MNSEGGGSVDRSLRLTAPRGGLTLGGVGRLRREQCLITGLCCHNKRRRIRHVAPNGQMRAGKHSEKRRV